MGGVITQAPSPYPCGPWIAFLTNPTLPCTTLGK